MNNFKKYFTTQQLVCPHVLKNYREEQIWSFFDPRVLTVLMELRIIIGKPIIVNSTSLGFTQRGLRCNCCDLVASKTRANKPYLSGHLRGTAIDFHVPGMTAEEVRQMIVREAAKLSYPIRLERGVNWVHFDVDNMTDEKVVFFNG